MVSRSAAHDGASPRLGSLLIGPAAPPGRTRVPFRSVALGAGARRRGSAASADPWGQAAAPGPPGAAAADDDCTAAFHAQQHSGSPPPNRTRTHASSIATAERGMLSMPALAAPCGTSKRSRAVKAVVRRGGRSAVLDDRNRPEARVGSSCPSRARVATRASQGPRHDAHEGEGDLWQPAIPPVRVLPGALAGGWLAGCCCC